jgi:2-dehydro-3-deoxyphosphooctonate aldolase (KDO 8-P synthase)
MSSTDHLAKVGNSVIVGEGKPLTLIGGPCVIESTELVMQVAETVSEICSRLGVQYIFKASFDKANRTSASTFRGPGVTKGLEVLQQVKDKLGLPVLTDIHESHHVAEVASVVDVLQIPAFLCRQTDLLVAAAETGKAINVKKGQFLSPQETAFVGRRKLDADRTRK